MPASPDVTAFATPIDGGPTRKRNASLTAERRIWSYRVVSDASVLFVAEQDEDGVGELFLSELGR